MWVGMKKEDGVHFNLLTGALGELQGICVGLNWDLDLFFLTKMRKKNVYILGICQDYHKIIMWKYLKKPKPIWLCMQHTPSHSETWILVRKEARIVHQMLISLGILLWFWFVLLCSLFQDSILSCFPCVITHIVIWKAFSFYHLNTQTWLNF